MDELPGSLTLSPGNVSNRVSLTTEVLPGLVANKVFRVRVKTCNDITCKTSQPVQLSELFPVMSQFVSSSSSITSSLFLYVAGTHYLHSASIAYTNSSTHVLLRCRYTNGSSVMGCLFIFKFNNTLTKSFNVSLEESTGHCAILSGSVHTCISVVMYIYRACFSLLCILQCCIW